MGVHIGATTGYNATFVLYKGLSKDPRYNSIMTYNWAPIGMSFGADFSRTFGLTLEGIKSTQGQVYELIDVARKVSDEREIELSYIHMPLLAKFMSSSNSGARTNFSLGRQLSFLTDAKESIHAQGGEFEIPDGVDFGSIKSEFPEATQTPAQASAGTYLLSETSQDILTKKSNDFSHRISNRSSIWGRYRSFRHLFLTTRIRANYSLMDMRNAKLSTQSRVAMVAMYLVNVQTYL